MRIRRAIPDDRDAMTACAQGFLAEATKSYGIPPDWTVVERLLPGLLAHPDVAIFVAESEGKLVGWLFAQVVPLWFAPHVRIAHESAWYLLPEARGGSMAVRLLRAFEGWARERGMRYAVTSSIDALEGERVTAFLARQGYRPTERSHMKEL